MRPPERARMFPPRAVVEESFARREREKIVRQQAQASTTPEMIERFARITKDYGWIAKSSAWALAKSGASDDTLLAVGKAEARRKARRPFGGKETGEEVVARGGGGYAGIGRRTRHEGGIGLGDVAGAISDVSKAVNPLDPRSSIGRAGFVAEQVGKVDEHIGRQPVISTATGKARVVTPREGAEDAATIAGSAGRGLFGAGERLGTLVTDKFTPPDSLPDTTTSVGSGGGPPSENPNVLGRGYAQQQGVVSDIAAPAKATARIAFTALEAPLQELQALAKASVVASPLTDEWLDAYRQVNTSTGRIALDQILSGEDVDLGSGFLPGGAVREQYERESAQLKFPGTNESVTLGRWVARQVVEPGSTPYQILSGVVDAGFSLAADPATYALAGAGKANVVGRASRGRLAEKAFTDMGLIDTVRRTTIPQKVERWIGSPEGRGVIRALADEGDINTIWQKSNQRLPIDIVRQIADTSDPAEVLDILRPHLGTTVRTVPTQTPTFMTTLKHQSRLLEGMPAAVSLTDADDAVRSVYLFGRTAKFDDYEIGGYVARMARSTNSQEKFKVVEDMLSSAKGVLVRNGMSPADARATTSMWKDSLESLRSYAIDEVGRNRVIPGSVVVDGALEPTPSPYLWVQTIHQDIPLGDVREVRRAMASKPVRTALNLPGVERTETLVEYLQGEVWKPIVLLRGAYTVRVIGEEQLRIAFSGLDSLFSAHPLSAIAYVTGRRGRTGLLGADDFLDDAAAIGGALNKDARSAGWVGESLTHGKVEIKAHETPFPHAWADNLAMYNADPVANAVANARGSLDDIMSAYWDGPLQKFRKDLIPTNPQLADRRYADLYIQDLWKQIEYLTGSHPDLLDAVGSGRIGDIPLRASQVLRKEGKQRLGDVPGQVPQNTRLNRRAVNALDDYMDSAPRSVPGDPPVTAKQQEGWRAATNAAFTWLMTKPTNYLSRSVAFKQYYWKRAEEMIGFMDEAAQQAAIQAAVDANLPKLTVARMRRLAERGSGDLDIDAADMVAKAYGLDETKRLLYDLTERSQFFDATRLIFPFGEAWKEMVTRWTKIGLVERPQTIRRGQQFFEGARGNDVIDALNPVGQGFFYTNDQGEEVFAYPGTGWISEAMFDVPVPLVGRVAGLSLMTEVLPGVGPAVQIPAAWIIPNKPEYEELRELIIPFGEQDTSEGILESFFPAWFRKVGSQALGQGRDERLWSNTTQDVARWLQSTGDYPTDTPGGLRRLEETAVRKSKWVYLFRGAVQFGAPSAPTPDWVVKDKTGNMILASKVIDDFRQWQEDDYDSAVGRFLDTYGEDLSLLMQPKSSTIAPVYPASKEAERWVLDHPDVRDKYPYVYGFFAPQGGEFDFGVYNRQFESGERDPITLDQALKLANHRIGSYLYYKARDSLPERPSPEQRAWIRDFHDRLVEDYPGFEDLAGTPQKAEPDDVIRQLEQAVKDPLVRRTEAGKGARLLMKAWNNASAAVEEAGLSPDYFQDGKRAAPIRAQLRDYAARVAEKYPDSAMVWERVFERELTDDFIEEAED